MPRNESGRKGGTSKDRFGPSEPVGIERARRKKGSPPRAPRPSRQVEKPDIPESVTVDLPGRVLGDVRRHARDAEDVGRALTLATDMLEIEDAQGALAYLEWAKNNAPRSASVRETLGIAYYLAERWGDALSELQTYRRLSGSQDQNHLIADCLRAEDRPTDLIAEAVEAMDDDDGRDRVVEGHIVWASTVAERGNPAAGRAILDQVLEMPDEPGEDDLRAWYVAGDLAERDGDADTARRWFERVADVDTGLYDVDERLRNLAG